MLDALSALATLDAGLAAVDGDMVRRPWGLLFYNPANPQHYDSNTARQIRTGAPDAVIVELIAFYEAHDLNPRVKCDPLTEPADFAARLRAYGFRTTDEVNRLMVWEGAPRPEPALAAGVAVERGTLADLAEIARVQAEGFENDSDAWIRGFLLRELVHPAVHWYVARVDGVAAAAVALFLDEASGLIVNVATVPAYRERGLATALIARAQSVARRPLLLEVVEANAERVYRRAGFEPWGELRQTTGRLERVAGHG
jgi:GNAT superfamily N-acetyltransferase